ncbi:MAG TPA: hypothetical protein VJT16_16470 [Streptosporangiaceae bacterium]|nr:hypothetical protein [Streptosporangiaceae bacterium]
MDCLSRRAAAVLRWCAWLLPAGRAEWAEAILAEAENVPAGWQRLAWLGGGLRMVSGESMIMRKAGAICAFAVAVGCIASLSWPQSAVNRVTIANRAGLLVTVTLLVGLWAAGRRIVGPARAGRAQRLVRAGGYSAVLALTLGKVSVERMRDPASLGPGAGGLLWTGETLFLLMMAIFTAAVIMATAQRSPVTTGTLLRGIVAGLPIGIAVFVFLPLGVVRYQASRVLPAVPQGALQAIAWAAVLVAPAVAGVLASRRFTSDQALPPAAGPASGFSARLRKAFALDGADTDGAAANEARIRQGVAAGLVAGLTGAMLAVLLGTATIALLPHDSQLLGWLYPHLSHAATLPAEQGAGGNAAGYLLLLLAVPFAGLGAASVAVLIANPDPTQPPGGGHPRGDDPPAIPPPPDGGEDCSPDTSTEPVLSLT